MSSENAFGRLARFPRLFGERDINSLDKQTQALTDTCSDSLSVAPFALDITLDYITLFTPTIFAASWGITSSAELRLQEKRLLRNY